MSRLPYSPPPRLPTKRIKHSSLYPGWQFHPHVTSSGGVCATFKGLSVPELLGQVDALDKTDDEVKVCAFDTEGRLFSRLKPRSSWLRFSTNPEDGIFVRISTKPVPRGRKTKQRRPTGKSSHHAVPPPPPPAVKSRDSVAWKVYADICPPRNPESTSEQQTVPQLQGDVTALCRHSLDSIGVVGFCSSGVLYYSVPMRRYWIPLPSGNSDSTAHSHPREMRHAEHKRAAPSGHLVSPGLDPFANFDSPLRTPPAPPATILAGEVPGYLASKSSRRQLAPAVTVQYDVQSACWFDGSDRPIATSQLPQGTYIRYAAGSGHARPKLYGGKSRKAALQQIYSDVGARGGMRAGDLAGLMRRSDFSALYGNNSSETAGSATHTHRALPSESVTSVINRLVAERDHSKGAGGALGTSVWERYSNFVRGQDEVRDSRHHGHSGHSSPGTHSTNTGNASVSGGAGAQSKFVMVSECAYPRLRVSQKTQRLKTLSAHPFASDQPSGHNSPTTTLSFFRPIQVPHPARRRQAVTRVGVLGIATNSLMTSAASRHDVIASHTMTGQHGQASESTAVAMRGGSVCVYVHSHPPNLPVRLSAADAQSFTAYSQNSTVVRSPDGANTPTSADGFFEGSASHSDQIEFSSESSAPCMAYRFEAFVKPGPLRSRKPAQPALCWRNFQGILCLAVCAHPKVEKVTVTVELSRPVSPYVCRYHPWQIASNAHSSSLELRSLWEAVLRLKNAGKRLVDRGTGNSPVHCACLEGGHPSFVRTLLTYFPEMVDLNGRNTDGLTAVQILLCRNHESMETETVGNDSNAGGGGSGRASKHQAAGPRGGLPYGPRPSGASNEWSAGARGTRVRGYRRPHTRTDAWLLEMLRVLVLCGKGRGSKGCANVLLPADGFPNREPIPHAMCMIGRPRIVATLLGLPYFFNPEDAARQPRRKRHELKTLLKRTAMSRMVPDLTLGSEFAAKGKGMYDLMPAFNDGVFTGDDSGGVQASEGDTGLPNDSSNKHAHKDTAAQRVRMQRILRATNRSGQCMTEVAKQQYARWLPYARDMAVTLPPRLQALVDSMVQPGQLARESNLYARLGSLFQGQLPWRIDILRKYGAAGAPAAGGDAAMDLPFLALRPSSAGAQQDLHDEPAHSVRSSRLEVLPELFGQKGVALASFLSGHTRKNSSVLTQKPARGAAKTPRGVGEFGAFTTDKYASGSVVAQRMAAEARGDEGSYANIALDKLAEEHEREMATPEAERRHLKRQEPKRADEMFARVVASARVKSGHSSRLHSRRGSTTRTSPYQSPATASRSLGSSGHGGNSSNASTHDHAGGGINAPVYHHGKSGATRRGASMRRASGGRTTPITHNSTATSSSSNNSNHSQGKDANGAGQEGFLGATRRRLARDERKAAIQQHQNSMRFLQQSYARMQRQLKAESNERWQSLAHKHQQEDKVRASLTQTPVTHTTTSPSPQHHHHHPPVIRAVGESPEEQDTRIVEATGETGGAAQPPVPSTSPSVALGASSRGKAATTTSTASSSGVGGGGGSSSSQTTISGGNAFGYSMGYVRHKFVASLEVLLVTTYASKLVQE